MAGENIAIWEVQSGAANGTEATATSTHTQLFNSTTKTPSVGAFINDIQVIPAKSTPELESVNADNNELQDMGIEGLTVILSGVSGDADYNVAANWVNKYIKWIKDGNTTTGYTKGRFGLRMDNAPQWGVVPTSTYGYHILRDSQWSYVGDSKDLVKFTVKLALGGDITNAI